MPTHEEVQAACRRLCEVARKVPRAERRMPAALVALQRLHDIERASSVDRVAHAKVTRQLRQMSLAQRLSTRSIYSRRKGR